MIVKRINLMHGLVVLVIIFSSFFQAYNLPKSVAAGKPVYETYCMNCHMADGKGTPDVFPPLAKADYMKKPGRT
jgi:nitrite reductase (NO-forming)